MQVKWSSQMDPTSWEPEGGSIYCPRWLQPAVFWVLRKYSAVRARINTSG